MLTKKERMAKWKDAMKQKRQDRIDKFAVAYDEEVNAMEDDSDHIKKKKGN